MLDPYIFLAMVRVELTCTVVLQAYRQTAASLRCRAPPREVGDEADRLSGCEDVRMSGCQDVCAVHSSRTEKMR